MAVVEYLLLQHGANVNGTGGGDETFLEEARREGRAEVARFLERQGAV